MGAATQVLRFRRLREIQPEPECCAANVGWSGEVDLRVFVALGREVWQLVHDRQPAGWYSVEIDLGTLSSGLYLYRLETRDKVKVRTMLLVK